MVNSFTSHAGGLIRSVAPTSAVVKTSDRATETQLDMATNYVNEVMNIILVPLIGLQLMQEKPDLKQ